MYLVKYVNTWADEIDIYGLALLSDRDKYFFENLSESVFPLIHNVGKRDLIITYSNKKELLKCYEWITLNKKQQEVLIPLINSTYGNLYLAEAYGDFYLDSIYGNFYYPECESEF